MGGLVMSIRKLLFVSIVILVVSGGLGAPALAQSIFLEPHTEEGIYFEYLKPSISGFDFTGTSFTGFLSSRARISETLSMRVELPITHFEDQNDDFYAYFGLEESHTEIGNIYLGVEPGPWDQGLQGEFGLRFPTFNGDGVASLVGTLSDPIERLDAFASDVLPIYLGGNYRSEGKNGFKMFFNDTATTEIYTDDTENTDVFVIHSIQMYYESRKFSAGMGLSGNIVVTGDSGGPGDRSIYQLGVFASGNFGVVRPGLQIRIPLDDDMKDVQEDPTFSLSLTIVPGS
jgi:hypothetical protein